MWMITGTSSTPMIGMSASVFGVLGYYMMRFPKSQIAYMYLIFRTPYWWSLPAKWLVLCKIFSETAYTFFDHQQQSGIAHAAHIGGAGVGLLIGYLVNETRQDIQSHSKNYF